MAEERAKRKLSAILSADVKGYSRMMEEDELSTVRTLEAYRKVMSNVILKYRGRVVDSPGDNLLAEFASVVDAVESAVEIQKELGIRNVELTENRRMEFRIGINLGDVIEEGDRIYGDGVNIAARMEGLAVAGGISVSGTVFEHIKGKLTLGYEYQGDQTIKNISQPVKVYRILTELEAVGKVIVKEGIGPLKQRWISLAAVAAVIIVMGGVVIWQFYFRFPSVALDPVAKVTFSLPDKPSIAVLPFDNLSGDPKQEYFSDGMTEDLITDLSKISGLFVIARHSTFQYKGKSVDVKTIGRELGIRYVLEGSVRKADNKVRINAQLIDATTGGHIWAERYDGDLEDIFALQDEVTQKIVAALAVRLTDDEQNRLIDKYTNNMEAYDFFLQGSDYLNQQSQTGNLQARQMFEKAIEVDSKFALAYAINGRTHLMEWTMGWSKNSRPVEAAFELAKKAIALDDSLPDGHALLGDVLLWKKKYEQAIVALKTAVILGPNDADMLAGFAAALSWAGRPSESIGLIKKAMRLNPRYPIWYLWTLGHAYFLTGQHDPAINRFKSILNRNPNFMPAHVYLTSIYIQQGRDEEARIEAAEVGRLSPHTSLEDWKQRLPYKDQSVLNRLIDSLRKAGLK